MFLHVCDPHQPDLPVKNILPLPEVSLSLKTIVFVDISTVTQTTETAGSFCYGNFFPKIRNISVPKDENCTYVTLKLVSILKYALLIT